MAEKKQERKADDRVRNFATVVYPESAPENWQETLAGEFIPSFISPLHDKDINPGGEPKKPHYHVILMFEGKKSMEQVKEITAKIGGVGLVGDSLSAQRGYLVNDLLSLCVVGVVVYRNVISSFGERYGAGSAYTARSACDERNLFHNFLRLCFLYNNCRI